MRKLQKKSNLLKMKILKKISFFLFKWGMVLFGVLAMAALGAYLSVKVAVLGTEVKVPEILNLTEEEACHILSMKGLFLEITGERIDDGVSQERILSQDPIAGSKIRKGRKIKVILSLGAKILQVPSVLGYSERSAKVKIHQKGLNVGWLAYVHSKIRETKILAQSPSAGVEKLKGGRLNLLVSKGKRKKGYVMQNLVGKDIASIIPPLESCGLRVGILKKKGGSVYQHGTIVSQYPLRGYPISEGEIVKVTILE